MSGAPTALELASLLEKRYGNAALHKLQAAAMLRSQHEAIQELRAACKAFSGLYGRLWDLADNGAGLLSPESVKKYDEVHELMEALVKSTEG